MKHHTAGMLNFLHFSMIFRTSIICSYDSVTSWHNSVFSSGILFKIFNIIVLILGINAIILQLKHSFLHLFFFYNKIRTNSHYSVGYPPYHVHFFTSQSLPQCSFYVIANRCFASLRYIHLSYFVK